MILEAIGMPSMRPLDEKKFREEYDLDKDGRLNKVSIKRKEDRRNLYFILKKTYKD